MKYTNPIVTGCNPDPSVCRVGNDYYLVNSTFEYFPGLPIYHSTDLIHWEQIGHVLTRTSQMTLPVGAPNRYGLFAPTLRYHNGRFYCVVTNVNVDETSKNFYVTTDDIYGEWSEPIVLDFDGIDPSFFFDEDGRCYYTGTDGGGVFICEIDIETGKRVGEKHHSWNGTGGNNPEGPHLYNINGWYYLMIAEGGTELCHMVTIARSKNVYGPYEECPWNPILTNSRTLLPLKAIGHADLVQDINGRWWAVCLGNRPTGYPFHHLMGRETMLVPVVWKEDWPVLGVNGRVFEEMEVECFAGEPTPNTGRYIPGSDYEDTFSEDKLHLSWSYIYKPDEKMISLSDKGLCLRGVAASVCDDTYKTILVRRQEHFDFESTMHLNFAPAEGEEAGLSIYMNNQHHYDIALTKLDGEQCLIIRRQIGKLKAMEAKVPYDGNEVVLQINGSREEYALSYSKDGEEFTKLGCGESQYLSTEVGGCFTGNMIALYASGNGKEAENDAYVTKFTYKAL